MSQSPNIIAVRRADLGLTQAQLGRLANIAPKTIGLIERGESNLQLRTLSKLARVFHCSTQTLLSELTQPAAVATTEKRSIGEAT